jgi:PKD repeat protein
MTGATGACTDGGTISTVINANQLLGYSSARLNGAGVYPGLINPQIASAGNPKAKFRAAHSKTTSLTVDFNGSSSYCPNGSCTYAWDFDGNGTTDATGVTATKVYSAAGKYTVYLTVTDNTNGGSAKMKAVVVAREINHKPVAGGSTAIAGRDVTFTDASTDADNNISTIYIYWGDRVRNTVAKNGSIAHTYAKKGTFTINQVVIDSKGARSSKSYRVKIAQ